MGNSDESFRQHIGVGRDALDSDLYPLTHIFMSSIADNRSGDELSAEEIVRALIPIISSLEQRIQR